MLELINKANCCGCTACKSICPKNAIKMQEDEEGFLYPVIEQDKCINCGLCQKVCPILNKVQEVKCDQEAYLVNNKDIKVREQSTSGGAFTAIANYVITNKGVVYGAAFDDRFNVYHTYIESTNDLEKFRGSKYVQSDLKDTFKEVKSFLDNNRIVCYSGTPCQIEGLKKYLGKDYDNLITVDIVCHAVPSPLVWRKYLEYQQEKLELRNIKRILFRDKRKYGYKYSTMTIEAENKTYNEGVETDPYLRAFFGDLSDRPSCYECKFKKQNRVSDFTIWDCFIVGDISKKLDDDKGTSRVLIHTEHGKKIFQKIKDDFYYEKVSVEILVNNVREMYYSVNKNNKREQFFIDINKMDVQQFFKKYFPDNLRVKLERNIRKILVKTGIYSKTKKIVKKIIGKK